jgi:hypothetical protein
MGEGLTAKKLANAALRELRTKKQNRESKLTTKSGWSHQLKCGEFPHPLSPSLKWSGTLDQN